MGAKSTKDLLSTHRVACLMEYLNHLFTSESRHGLGSEAGALGNKLLKPPVVDSLQSSLLFIRLVYTTLLYSALPLTNRHSLYNQQ